MSETPSTQFDEKDYQLSSQSTSLSIEPEPKTLPFTKYLHIFTQTKTPLPLLPRYEAPTRPYPRPYRRRTCSIFSIFKVIPTIPAKIMASTRYHLLPAGRSSEDTEREDARLISPLDEPDFAPQKLQFSVFPTIRTRLVVIPILIVTAAISRKAYWSSSDCRDVMIAFIVLSIAWESLILLLFLITNCHKKKGSRIRLKSVRMGGLGSRILKVLWRCKRVFVDIALVCVLGPVIYKEQRDEGAKIVGGIALGFMVFSMLDLGYPGSCEYTASLRYDKGRIHFVNGLTFGLPKEDDDEPELGEEAYRDERVSMVAEDARGNVTITSDARAGKANDDGIMV